MSEHPLLRADQILRSLLDAGVDFVLIGGLASQVHGSPSLTGDVDICFALNRDNLHRLSDALASMAVIRRGFEPGMIAPLDHRALRAGGVLTLSTRYGDLDLLAHPDPGLDFQALQERSIVAEIFGQEVRVASLADLMDMKRAAGRPKDRIELEILGALRDELDRRDA
jgi:predicted nucleotidyltransferase